MRNFRPVLNSRGPEFSSGVLISFAFTWIFQISWNEFMNTAFSHIQGSGAVTGSFSNSLG